MGAAGAQRGRPHPFEARARVGRHRRLAVSPGRRSRVDRCRALRAHDLDGSAAPASTASTTGLSMSTRKAFALWRGAPLPEVASWPPGTAEAARLVELRTSAEEELLDARLLAGEDRGVIPEAEQLVREDPLREDRWAILALANYRANRQADALAVLRAARARLDDELGVEPGPAARGPRALGAAPGPRPRRAVARPRGRPRSAPTPVCGPSARRTPTCSSGARPTRSRCSSGWAPAPSSRSRAPPARASRRCSSQESTRASVRAAPRRDRQARDWRNRRAARSRCASKRPRHRPGGGDAGGDRCAA